MTRDPYTLDLRNANGPLLVSREIANFLRRVPKTPPAACTGLAVIRSGIKGTEVMPLERDESAPKGWKLCWTVYCCGTARGPFYLVETPTIKAAEFVAESLSTLWGFKEAHYLS